MKLTQLQRKNMRIAIVQLAEKEVRDKTMGICWNLNQLFEQGRDFLDVYDFVAYHGAKWPGRTGKMESCGRLCVYPIQRGYDANGDRLPLWVGDQYTQRMSLLRYLLAQVA